MKEFLSPLPLAAVALMAVNDSWLKQAFHNAITGKLSDFAGCFFLPLYVSALLSLVTSWNGPVRLGLGAAVTLAIFIPVSVSPSAARVLCDVLAVRGAWLGFHGYRIASDPTDLMALPCVAVAVWYGLPRTISDENQS
ncbi:MAG: hypothetical protein AB2A00_13125 [Myxococcota bacterium]